MIRLRSLRYEYPGGGGVSGIDLDIPSGGACSVIGSSGCGKTTMLHLIAGLITPQSGSIETSSGKPTGSDNANPVTAGAALRPQLTRRPGLVQQSDALFPWLTGLGNVLLPAPRETGRAGELLEELGVGHCASRYPGQMSGGERQRVSLARSLMNSPEILLLDEPSAALDAFTRESLQDLLLAVQQERKVTCIYVTHGIEEALFLAPRVYVMERGRLAAEYDNPLFPDPQAREHGDFYRRAVELRKLLGGHSSASAGGGAGASKIGYPIKEREGTERRSYGEKTRGAE